MRARACSASEPCWLVFTVTVFDKSEKPGPVFDYFLKKYAPAFNLHPYFLVSIKGDGRRYISCAWANPWWRAGSLQLCNFSKQALCKSMSASEREKKSIPKTTPMLVSANNKSPQRIDSFLDCLEARNMLGPSYRSSELRHRISLSFERFILAPCRKFVERSHHLGCGHWCSGART